MNHKFWDLTARQLAGKATAAEQEELRRWLEAEPAHKEQYRAQEELWRLSAPGPVPEVDTSLAWQKVKAGIQQEKKKPHRGVISMFPMAFRVAASIALLFGVLLLSRYLFFPFYGMETAESGNSPVLIRLPDSSQVWLNRESKLIYDPDFMGTERLVHLKGEAFFEVQKDPKRPFIIQANNTQTKVLGTSFNLRAYPFEEATELVVATGKVSFGSELLPEVILTPGEAAKLSRESAAIERYRSSGRNVWAWKSGTLKFEGQALESVINDLERFYGVQLRLKNPATAACRFTGEFNDAGLEEVLQVLTTTLQLEYSQKDNTTYTLSGQGCK